MKILVIGGNGIIGSAVVHALKPRHTVLVAGKTRGDVQVDITQESSIEQLYKEVGSLDAVIACAGHVHFGAFPEMSAAQYHIGLNDKLMGQVNLVRHGLAHLAPGGSFTLTSGILNVDPIQYGSSAAMVNGALEGFIKSAAIEMPKGYRINLVSPTVITQAMPDYEPYFRGFVPAPAELAALAYMKSVEGLQTGQVYRVGY